MERKNNNVIMGIFYSAVFIAVILLFIWRFGLQGIENWNIGSKPAAYLLGNLSLIITIVAVCLKLLCKNKSGLFYLSTLTFMLAVWIYLRSGVVSPYFEDSNINESIKFTMLLLVPIPTMYFFNAFQNNRYQKLYTPFMIISLLDWAICFVCVNLTNLNVADLYMSGQIVMMMGLISCVYTLFLDTIYKRMRCAFGMLCSMILMVIGCIMEIFYVYNREVTWIDKIFGYLILVVVIFNFINAVNTLIVRFNETQQMHFQQERNRLINKLNAELQKPMTNILQLNESILDKCMDEDIYLTTAEINNEGNTMLRLIHNVMDCVSLQNEEFICHEEIFKWSDVYNDIIEKVFQETERKGIELVLNVAEDMPDMMYGDIRCINGILENIFDNAVRYVTQGKITMNVGWIAMSDDTVKVFTSIEDTGVGIAPELLHDLEYAFSHLDEVDEYDLQGIGYGLQTVIRLARIIHDTLEIESDTQKGTTIRIACTHKVAEHTPIGEFQNWYVMRENSYHKFKKRITELKKNKKENGSERYKGIEKRLQSDDTVEENSYVSLEENQVHVRNALKYVGNDFRQYIELMKMFPKKAPEKQAALIRFWMEKDYQNYTILVHSLKNNARTLGADDMADMAYALEMASSKEDEKFIQENMDRFVGEWKRVQEVFQKYLEHMKKEEPEEQEEKVLKITEESWNAQIEQIQKYLDSFKKKEALESLEGLKKYALAENKVQLLDEAIETIKKYDYAKAIMLLGKA